MSTNLSTNSEALLARSVAAEDIRCGDVVAVLNTIVELPSFLWCCDAEILPPHEPVRVLFRPRNPGMPLMVKAVCLPFVLVKSALGQFRTLDVRQCRLVRLNADYAKAVSKSLRKKSRQGSKRSPR